MQRFIIFCLLFSVIGFTCFAQQMQFKHQASVRCRTDDGHPCSSQAFEAPDGTRVFKTSETRDSATVAKKVLNKKIQSAVKILEQSLKLDRQGKQVCKRVVALFSNKNSNQDYVSIL
jgi:hypothetical protein